MARVSLIYDRNRGQNQVRNVQRYNPHLLNNRHNRRRKAYNQIRDEGQTRDDKTLKLLF
jgi:hypothetical protein